VFDELAEDFATHPSVIIATLNCTRESSLCGTLGVRRYPAIWTYFRGQTQYVKGRSYDTFSAAGACLKALAGVAE
jgi:hypothetical protein